MKKVIVLAAILVTIGSAVYATDPPKTAPLPATSAPPQISAAGNQNGSQVGVHNVPVGGGVTVGGNATFNGNGQPTGAEGGVHIPF
jgi:hypothetical protein